MLELVAKIMIQAYQAISIEESFKLPRDSVLSSRFHIELFVLASTFGKKRVLLMVFVFPNTRDLVAYSGLVYSLYPLKQPITNCLVSVNAVVLECFQLARVVKY